MKSSFRRGFKKRAEELALAVRAEMGLSWGDRLDPRALARHVRIPVFELDEMVRFGLSQGSLRALLGSGRREFSAGLFQRGALRVIVANPAHSVGRQASNIVHEVAHLVLEHEPPGVLLELGCRRWDALMEDEANWLAGELLVPRTAALAIAREQQDANGAAIHFGVSLAMMKWRLNHSGAMKQAGRERAARQHRHWWPISGSKANART